MNLRDKLKQETTLLHQQAEAATNAHASVDHIEGYVKFLMGMFFVYSKYSMALDQSSELLGLKIRSSEILKNLKLDLTNMGHESVFSQKEALPDKLSNDALLGIAYVFEGSAIGSGIMLKKVQANFQDTSLSHNYLKFMSKDIGLRWPATIKKLSECADVKEESIVQASQVFKAVTKVMESLSE